jgi:pimeloyl-ACP methyl ester carboxylesterase
MHSETVSLQGQPFFLRRWGDPALPRLLLLHGFPEYGGAWSDVAAHLSDRFCCLAPDQRGFGQSWAPDDVAAYTTSKLVADMADLIRQTGDGPIAVFGHDWGAAVAYGLAMFRPELVSQLIIANGVHPVPFQRALAAGGAQSEASQYILFLRGDGSETAMSADNFARMERFFRAKMTTDWLTADRLEDYRREWARPGKLKTMIHWYRASPLAVASPGQPISDLPPLPLEKLHVRCPHLLIWGEQDQALLPEATEGLDAFCADLTRISLPDCDHWLLHQKPDVIADIALNWLDKKHMSF